MIRQIKERDVATLAEFEREISQISFGDEAVIDLEVHQRKIEKARKYEHKGMLVVELEGKAVGWLWMTPRDNALTGETYINFKSFYIAEPYRGSDWVDQLFEAGMEFCRKVGARRVVGKVHSGNLPMRVLYKNHGFTPTHLTMEYTFPAADAEVGE